jgi:hypothetical protein
VQALEVAEVGKLEVKAPAMMVVWNVVLGGESSLGEGAIHSAVAVVGVSAR